MQKITLLTSLGNQGEPIYKEKILGIKVFFLHELMATRTFLNCLRGNGGNVVVWTNGLPGYLHLLPSHLHHL